MIILFWEEENGLEIYKGILDYIKKKFGKIELL